LNGTLRVIEGYKQVLNDDRIGGIAFGDPADLPPLQAADLVAWEFRRHQINPTEMRRTLKRLLDMNPIIYR
jgi:hypothetical protein